MNQKRSLSLALAAAMALSLTACGSKSDSSGGADDTPTGVAVQVQPVMLERKIATERKLEATVVVKTQAFTKARDRGLGSAAAARELCGGHGGGLAAMLQDVIYDALL